MGSICRCNLPNNLEVLKTKGSPRKGPSHTTHHFSLILSIS